jgi:hypothetical protein
VQHSIATKKKRQAKKSVRSGECVLLGGCTIVATVGPAAQCVRSACEARVRRRWFVYEVNGEYPSAVVGYEMRYAPWIVYNHRAPASRLLRPSSTSHRHVKSDLAEHQTGAFGTSRLSHPCKRLRLSGLPITQYNTRHMEWGFYSVKPAIGAEGVRPGYTTATATHSPPQIFFRQLAPFALALHL